jgi:hypothetical protein
MGTSGCWGGEYMPYFHLQIHPVIIYMTSLVMIWDFRLRPALVRLEVLLLLAPRLIIMMQR